MTQVYSSFELKSLLIVGNAVETIEISKLDITNDITIYNIYLINANNEIFI